MKKSIFVFLFDHHTAVSKVKIDDFLSGNVHLNYVSTLAMNYLNFNWPFNFQQVEIFPECYTKGNKLITFKPL